MKLHDPVIVVVCDKTKVAESHVTCKVMVVDIGFKSSPRRRGKTCADMDGAVRQQGGVELHGPDAVRTLHFPHAADHMPALMAMVLGTSTGAPRC